MRKNFIFSHVFATPVIGPDNSFLLSVHHLNMLRVRHPWHQELLASSNILRHTAFVLTKQTHMAESEQHSGITKCHCPMLKFIILPLHNTEMAGLSCALVTNLAFCNNPRYLQCLSLTHGKPCSHIREEHYHHKLLLTKQLKNKSSWIHLGENAMQ